MNVGGMKLVTNNELRRQLAEKDAECQQLLDRLVGGLNLAHKVELTRLLADMHSAWGVIANVSGGDWTQQSAEWQEAASRWRDLCFHAHALAGRE